MDSVPSEREVLQTRLQDFGEQLHAAERMAAVAMQTYKTHGERAALRCALGDAASLCDAMARDLDRNYRGSRGRSTKAGQAFARCAKLCAEAIWLMREQIKMPDTQ